jgi:hypothetical protein
VLPRKIDILIKQSSNAGWVGKTFLGLCEITGGNTMNITANDPGTARPTTMDNVINLINNK